MRSPSMAGKSKTSNPLIARMDGNSEGNVMTDLSHAIWWHVYPLGALGAPTHAATDAPAREHTKFEPWLDYALELGCNGLLLGPIFDSVSHGYDTLDHFRIDARLGTEADFDRLVAACKERGVQLILDGVFNHVAYSHKFITERPDMVRWVDGHPLGWEGNFDLVELQHTNADVQQFVGDVMLYWLRKGITGWRLDVAYSVSPQFWSSVIGRVREEFPDAVFLGEVIHGDYPKFVEASGVDTVTQYELWKAIWSSINDSNPWELAHALERHVEFCRHFLPQTFVGNHDVTRVASSVGADGAALAAGVLLTVPGLPSIYYGDEQGFTGIKREAEGGDTDIRQPLPESPSELSTLGAQLHRWYQQLIGFRRRHAWLSTGQLAVTYKADGVLDYSISTADQRVDVHVDYAARRMSIVAPDEELHTP